jgi:hypothetical protein
MKKHSPSYGQNGQLVHWWVLAHSGQFHGSYNFFGNLQLVLLSLYLPCTSCVRVSSPLTSKLLKCLSNPASKTYTKFVYEEESQCLHLHDLATWFFTSSQYQNSSTKSKLLKFKSNLASQKCTKIVWKEEESKISYPPLFGHKSSTW